MLPEQTKTVKLKGKGVKVLWWGGAYWTGGHWCTQPTGRNSIQTHSLDLHIRHYHVYRIRRQHGFPIYTNTSTQYVKTLRIARSIWFVQGRIHRLGYTSTNPKQTQQTPSPIPCQQGGLSEIKLLCMEEAVVPSLRPCLAASDYVAQLGDN